MSSVEKSAFRCWFLFEYKRLSQGLDVMYPPLLWCFVKVVSRLSETSWEMENQYAIVSVGVLYLHVRYRVKSLMILKS